MRDMTNEKDTQGYDDSERYEKLEDNVYLDVESDETVFVLTPEQREMMRNFRGVSDGSND